MSCIIANTSGTAIPLGTPVVIDPTNGQARAFDEVKDGVDEIVGVTYPNPNQNNGRAFRIYDGTAYYDKDFYIWGENLVMQLNGQGDPQENPNYEAFNPITDTDNYCFVMISGLAAVDVNYVDLPLSWVKVRDGTNYDWFIIR